GATPPPGSFEQLANAYAQPQRHYHNAAHVLACLQHLDRHQGLAAQPALVEFALWTHDLVYDTRRQDNEAASAAQACQWLRDAGLDRHSAAVSVMILATTHRSPASGDAALVVDIDLSILAAPAEVYGRYQAAVRREFAWVPEPVFRQGRAQLLKGLLEMPALYQVPALAEGWEAAARANLSRELAALQEPSPPAER